MYKVFVENTPVKIQKESQTFDKFLPFLPRLEKKDYPQFVDLVKNEASEKLIISADEAPDFFSELRAIEAAGGIVHHTTLNKYLFIYRLGKWDLPKGKIDTGETPEKAAAREIREECGITGMRLQHAIEETYHTYQLYGDTWIKKTHWFFFTYDKFELLAPETAEGITTARWFAREELGRVLANTYGNVVDVIEASLG